MKTWGRRLAAALLVLVLAFVAGTALVGLATAPAFLSGAVTQVLGRHVSIGAIQVRAGLRMRIELADVKIHATSDPASEVVLEAPRATGWQGWPRVLVGQLVPLTWKVDSPVVRARIQGGPTPALSLPAFDVEVADGRLELETPQGDYTVDKLRLEATQGVLLTSLRGVAEGEVRRGKSPLGRFSANFSGSTQRGRIQARLERVDLARLPLPESLQLKGIVRGQVALELKPDEQAASVSLDVAGLSLLVPGLDATIAPQRAQLKGDARWSGGTLSLRFDPLAIDDMVVRGPLTVSTAADGRVAMSIAFDPFQPGVLAGERLNGLRILGLRFPSLQRIHDRFEGGQLVDGKIDINLPRSEFESALSFNKPLRPDEISVHVRGVDAVFHSPGSEPFTGINGQIDIAGDVLSFREIRMARYGEPLPQIDVAIDGLSRFIHLPAEERYIPKGPGVGTPGLAAAVSALLPRPDASLLAAARAADAPPLVVGLSDLRLEHPALLMPIRNATAELRSRDGKLIAAPIRGVIGGGAADMRLEWDRKARKVGVEIRYDYAAAGKEPKRSTSTDDEVWLSGRFALDRLQLGPWPLTSPSGRLRAQGAEVQLSDISARVADGQLAASGQLMLDQPDAAPVAMAIDLRNADVAQVAHILEFKDESITGRGDARGPVRGRLDPNKPFLPGADIQLDVELREGTLARLPEALQLARLPSLQGVLGLFGRAMPYSRVVATFTIRNAVLRTERFALLGPELRILAAGEIDLGMPEKKTDMIVALLFVQTLDRVIEKVPFFGRLVLGPDESLLAVYLRLQGPWADPQVSLVPPNTLQAAAGWATRVLGRGLEGLRDLRDLVIPGREDKGDKEGQSTKTPLDQNLN